MNDCPNAERRDQLPDLLHDRLAHDARREVEAHLASCPPCRQELELLRAAYATLRRVPAVDAARIVAALPSPRRSARRTWAGWRTAAAITLIAVGGTSVAVATARHPASLADTRELPVASGVVGELNDHELSALLSQLESIEPVPPADLDNAAIVSPVSPARGGRR